MTLSLSTGRFAQCWNERAPADQLEQGGLDSNQDITNDPLTNSERCQALHQKPAMKKPTLDVGEYNDCVITAFAKDLEELRQKGGNSKLISVCLQSTYAAMSPWE